MAMGTIAVYRSTESRSLDVIGKISLVMCLHFNQSYSKNLSMWDIIKINTFDSIADWCEGIVNVTEDYCHILRVSLY